LMRVREETDKADGLRLVDRPGRGDSRGILTPAGRCDIEETNEFARDEIWVLVWRLFLLARPITVLSDFTITEQTIEASGLMPGALFVGGCRFGFRETTEAK